MSVSYEKLERDNFIVAYKAPPEQIAKELQLAARDIKVASKTLREANDWAFSIQPVGSVGFRPIVFS